MQFLNYQKLPVIKLQFLNYSFQETFLLSIQFATQHLIHHLNSQISNYFNLYKKTCSKNIELHSHLLFKTNFDYLYPDFLIPFPGYLQSIIFHFDPDYLLGFDLILIQPNLLDLELQGYFQEHFCLIN